MSAAPAQPAAGRGPWILAAILLGAFVLRVVYVLQSRANPYFDEPTMDAGYHLEWARAFARGEDFQPGPFFRAPAYPWFLGICLRLFGEDLLLVRLIQAGIGTLSCWLAYLVARRAFDARTGLVAAFLGATYWMVVYFDGELLLPVLEIPTCLAAILAGLAWRDRPSARRALLFGLSVGAAALVRPNILLFAPLVALWLGVRTRRDGPAAVARTLALAFAGLALPIAPVTLYNGIAGHDWTLISTQAGVNLWIGNNPQSDGASAVLPGTRADWWGGYQDTIQLAEASEGRRLKPSEVSEHYVRRVRAWWSVQPRAAVRLMLWKLRLFLTDRELGNNQDERFFALHFGPLLGWLPVGFGLVAPLGLLGLVLCARRWWSLFPLWGFVPVYTATVVLFFVNARFRMPVILPLAIFAAHALVWGADALRARRWRALLAATAAAIVLALGVHQVPAGLKTNEAQGWWQLGVYYAQHDDPATALEHFDQAVAIDPGIARIRRDRGLVLVQLKRESEAEVELRAAVGLQRSDPANLDELYAFLAAPERRRFAEAQEIAQISVETAPQYARGHYNLGRALFEQFLARRADGRPEPADVPRLERAGQSFRTAIEFSSTPLDRFQAYYALGETERVLGRAGAALGSWRKALESLSAPDEQGWCWACAERLLRACLEQQGRDGALAELARLEQRFGPKPELGALARKLGLR